MVRSPTEPPEPFTKEFLDSMIAFVEGDLSMERREELAKVANATRDLFVTNKVSLAEGLAILVMMIQTGLQQVVQHEHDTRH